MNALQNAEGSTPAIATWCRLLVMSGALPPRHLAANTLPTALQRLATVARDLAADDRLTQQQRRIALFVATLAASERTAAAVEQARQEAAQEETAEEEGQDEAAAGSTTSAASVLFAVPHLHHADALENATVIPASSSSSSTASTPASGWASWASELPLAEKLQYTVLEAAAGSVQLLLDAQSAAGHEPSQQFLLNNNISALYLQLNMDRAASLDCNIRNVLAFFSPLDTNRSAQALVGRKYLQLAAQRLDDASRLERLSHLLPLLSEKERAAFGFGTRTAAQFTATSKFLLEKVKRTRHAMHNDIISFLFARFDVVIWPKLQVRSIIRRAGRRFGRPMTRLLMNAIAHSELLSRAQLFAAQTVGKRVLSDADGVSECWSTRTCSRCGHVVEKFSHEEFHCEKCELTCHRDINAARNIFAINMHLILRIVRSRTEPEPPPEPPDPMLSDDERQTRPP